ncbi:MAG: hypothetical protein GY750_11575 [Lentisphaerae bacterium]|nr:hypothetical protein [Lentisphaerota bacterium]MCP4102054.1 hypothetical protein [Lentisphaerota bacterium]
MKLLLATATISLLAFTVSAVQKTTKAITKQEVTASISQYLNQQLKDANLSKKLAEKIVDSTLEWTPKTIDISKGDYILAYAFGNEIDHNGNKLPGKMNKALADLIVKIYNKIHKPVYAQWEIAQCIGNRIPRNMLHPIYPQITLEGEVIYLSTIGVAKDFARQVGRNSLKNAKVIIIAFKDHARRCVATSINNGINAYAPADYELPERYDSNSGQPWTRDKQTYMLQDMSVRLLQK